MNSSKAPVKILAGVREVNKFNLYKIVQRRKNLAVIEFSTKQTLLSELSYLKLLILRKNNPNFK